MKNFLICLVVALCLVAGTAHAGELREIELKDGSIIAGQLVSLKTGIYTIESDTLGTLKIEESKVKIIRPISPPQIPDVAQHNTGNEVTCLQRKMMNNHEIMDLIQSLQNDPEFMTLLEDPEILKAVNAGNVAALAANPKIMKLLENPTVQEIKKKVK